jgi:L-2-hydroxyglutarate oxidase LhgO
VADPGRSVAVVGGGVVGAAVAYDSMPGQLETELILRSAALRDPVLEQSGVSVLRCGAILRPRDDDEARTVAALAEGARANGVEVRLRDDGALEVPREAVTDPVADVCAPAAAAAGAGAEIRTRARVVAIGRERGRLRPALESGEEVVCAAAVNCAGLHADDVARLAGDDSFVVYPAGHGGANYVIGPSTACPGLVNVAAIRSTGLSASLGIGEHVAGFLAAQGIVLEPERPLPPAPAPVGDRPWCRRTALYRSGAAT